MKRFLTIPGLYNIRDLGGLPSDVESNTAYGRFFRSDSPHTIDKTGIAQLLDQGIRTVIDLRYADECVRSPNPLSTLSDVSYYNIPLMVNGAIEHNAEDLTHLGAFYRYLLHNSQPAFAQVFNTMATQSGATLFHCQVGKDRTGVVAAILLSLAGTSTNHIIEDYVVTSQYIAPLLPELRSHRPERINAEQYERLLDARAEFMLEFLNEIVTHHGNAHNYLLRIGVSERHIELLRQAITNPPK
jgi:protein-tyrosine phosphatase